MSVPWRPLLSGEAAARARAAARDVAAVTTRGAPPHAAGIAPEAFPIWDNTLHSGRAGQCLLHAYLALSGDGETCSDAALDLLDQATDAAPGLKMGTSLFLGFPGIAWAASHLENRLFTADEDGNRPVDEILAAALSREDWEGGFDLFDGLVGVGAYALERLPRPSAARLLETVVSRLAGRAERTPDGATFHSPQRVLPLNYQEHYPDGAYILGFGQGIAGVVALLGAACQAGVATGEARPLLEATISWLFARELPAGGLYRFPHFYLPGLEPYLTRVAWCTGDLGIAAALLVAARGAGVPAWEAEARRIALVAAARTVENGRVPDAGLCHGASGAGHVFNRLYQTTGEEELGRAARFWFERALDLREPGLGVAGFRTFASPSPPTPEPGFLTGATGIGLALLAACTPVEPAWDRLLLLSTLAPRI